MTPTEILNWGKTATPTWTQQWQANSDALSLGNAQARQAQLGVQEKQQQLSLAQQAQQYLPSAAAGDKQALMQLYTVAPEQAKSIHQALTTFNEQEKAEMVKNAKVVMMEASRLSDMEWNQKYKLPKQVATLQAQAILQSSTTPQSTAGKTVSDFQSGFIDQAQMNEALRKGPLVQNTFAPNSNEFKNIYQEESEKSDAKSDIELVKEVYDAAKLSTENDYRLARMEALLNEGTQTGAAEPYKYAVQKWLRAAGMNFDPSNQEELNRISNQLAFDELAKFKGPTSEKELAFALNLVGNLASEPGAIRRYIIVGQRMNQRNKAAQKFISEYVNRTGARRGVRMALGDWMILNPLIAAPRTAEDFQDLPIGAVYVDPEDGKLYLKK